MVTKLLKLADASYTHGLYILVYPHTYLNMSNTFLIHKIHFLEYVSLNISQVYSALGITHTYTLLHTKYSAHRPLGMSSLTMLLIPLLCTTMVNTSASLAERI